MRWYCPLLSTGCLHSFDEPDQPNQIACTLWDGNRRRCLIELTMLYLTKFLNNYNKLHYDDQGGWEFMSYDPY